LQRLKEGQAGYRPGGLQKLTSIHTLPKNVQPTSFYLQAAKRPENVAMTKPTGMVLRFAMSINSLGE
jgi:hypothetical protein